MKTKKFDGSSIENFRHMSTQELRNKLRVQLVSIVGVMGTIEGCILSQAILDFRQEYGEELGDYAFLLNYKSIIALLQNMDGIQLRKECGGFFRIYAVVTPETGHCFHLINNTRKRIRYAASSSPTGYIPRQSLRTSVLKHPQAKFSTSLGNQKPRYHFVRVPSVFKRPSSALLPRKSLSERDEWNASNCRNQLLIQSHTVRADSKIVEQPNVRMSHSKKQRSKCWFVREPSVFSKSSLSISGNSHSSPFEANQIECFVTNRPMPTASNADMNGVCHVNSRRFPRKQPQFVRVPSVFDKSCAKFSSSLNVMVGKSTLNNRSLQGEESQSKSSESSSLVKKSSSRMWFVRQPSIFSKSSASLPAPVNNSSENSILMTSKSAEDLKMQPCNSSGCISNEKCFKPGFMPEPPVLSKSANLLSVIPKTELNEATSQNVGLARMSEDMHRNPLISESLALPDENVQPKSTGSSEINRDNATESSDWSVLLCGRCGNALDLNLDDSLEDLDI